MKTIRFTQRTEVIETYEINYTQSDFEYDCKVYQIENFSYEDLCRVFENEEDVMITVNGFYYNLDANEYMNGPHFEDAYEFFSQLMDDQAYEAGPWDSETVDLIDREIAVEDDESYPN